MARKLGTDPETGECLDCKAGDHGLLDMYGHCRCCRVKIP